VRRALLVALALATAACGRGDYPADLFPEMHHSPAQTRLEPRRQAVAEGAVPVTGREPPASFQAASAQANPVPRTPETMDHARLLYAQNCAMCHGRDGRAQTLTAGQFAAAGRVPPADLTAAPVQARSDGQLRWIVSNGLGGMPPFRDLLDEPERWTVVYAVRELGGR
jgi:mono/diheme cytochrome c family protein